MSRRSAYAIVGAAAALPRIAALLHERGAILTAFTDKGDDFARTFLASGTYGFIPGHPSAYTQPLYGFFLIPLYWIFGRSWEVVGGAHVVVAVATALVVFEIGRRVVSSRAGVIAALVATLHPYLVWHDVHMNREILDELLAAAIFLLTLVVADRGSRIAAAGLGLVLGIAILGNARLLVLPLVVAAFVVAARRARREAWIAAAVTIVACGVAVAPWAIRTDTSVGCLTITTDAKALWKANNTNTYRVLTHGGWIDSVPPLRGAPRTPQDQYDVYRRTGRVVPVNECATMRFYQHRVRSYWRDHPGGKAQLAALSLKLLWQPSVVETTGRPGEGTWLDTARRTVEPLYMIVVYVLAIVGLALVPRGVAALALLLLGYQTAVAMVFVGETRYRAPWDFVLALLAAATIVRAVEHRARIADFLRLRGWNRDGARETRRAVP